MLGWSAAWLLIVQRTVSRSVKVTRGFIDFGGISLRESDSAVFSVVAAMGGWRICG